MGHFAKGPDPVFVGVIVGGAAMLVGVVIVTTWYICRRRQGKSLLPTAYPGTISPTHHRPCTPGSMPISRSNMEITSKASSPRLSQITPKPRTPAFTIADRQSTLPVMSQRHQSFQRMLSHQLNMSNIEFSVQSVKQKEQPDLGVLKPELYKQASVDSLRSEHTPCGKLFFSLRYNQEDTTLIVSVIRAENLPAKDFSGTSDPYVKVYLLPDRKTKHQTKVHRKTLSPEFDERFVFSVPYKDLADRALQFNIFDFDRFSRHDVIGGVRVKDILGEGSLTRDTHFVRDVYASHQENTDMGEVMLSLCYLPTAGRLTLTVVKARNLKAMDITGNADPYIKVCLMCQGRRIKKRKTSVQRNTLNPVFNEALVFDVPQENVEDVSLLVKMVDYDRIGSDEFMGCVTLGSRVGGEAREHWEEMLEAPRRPVAMWYSLMEAQPLPTTNGKCCLRHRLSTDSGLSDILTTDSNGVTNGNGDSTGISKVGNGNNTSPSYSNNTTNSSSHDNSSVNSNSNNSNNSNSNNSNSNTNDVTTTSQNG